MTAGAQVLRHGLASCQVCVPTEWTDEQVERFTNLENPTGISSGWAVHRDGPDPERVPCADDQEGRVHLVLTC